MSIGLCCRGHSRHGMGRMKSSRVQISKRGNHGRLLVVCRVCCWKIVWVWWVPHVWAVRLRQTWSARANQFLLQRTTVASLWPTLPIHFCLLLSVCRIEHSIWSGLRLLQTLLELCLLVSHIYRKLPFLFVWTQADNFLGALRNLHPRQPINRPTRISLQIRLTKLGHTLRFGVFHGCHHLLGLLLLTHHACCVQVCFAQTVQLHRLELGSLQLSSGRVLLVGIMEICKVLVLVIEGLKVGSTVYVGVVILGLTAGVLFRYLDNFFGSRNCRILLLDRLG